jgi:hypothetical protein
MVIVKRKYAAFIIGLVLLYSLTAVFQSCIKPFEPSYKDTSTDKYVVQGLLTSEEGWHEVNVSKTSSVDEALYMPVQFCEVTIEDEFGNAFELENIFGGTYGIWMNQQDLVIGRGYQLRVKTPDGDFLESKLEYMTDGPEVLTPGYEIEKHPVQDIGDFLDGLQFYIDLKADDHHSHFYRWQLIETWEYHSRYPQEFYYDGEVQQISPPDSSEFYCWATDQVDEIFVLNTNNYTTNGIVNFPLHFVANTSSRLGVLYSLLIRQIALSEDAYIYWDQLRQNNSEQGGLYSSQPLAVRGNITNISNPDQDVLGFFQASTVTQLRIFVEPPENLSMLFSDKCDPNPLEHGFVEIKPYEYPAYLETIDGEVSMNLLNDECVLCTLRGGSNIKPDFWP